MDNEKMGPFISEMRKSLQLTQKELAEKLKVSDKAVSKWERNLSRPDISLLVPLSDILGITITELLKGEKADTDDIDVQESLDTALQYSEKTAKQKIALTQNTWALIFSIVLLLAVSIVYIVNVTVSGTFTWSLIPIAASIFIWLVFFPAIKMGTKGIIASLISLSLSSAPFLFVLDFAIDRVAGENTLVFPVSIRIAPFVIVFLWIAFFLFKKFKTRKLLIIAFLVFLSGPVSLLSNFLIASMHDQPWFGVQPILNIFTLTALAVILFAIELTLRNKER